MIRVDQEKVLVEVQESLMKIMGGTAPSEYATVDKETLDKFCKIEQIDVLEGYKAQLTTPWAIARYIVLITEAKSLEKDVKQRLETVVGDKANFYIHQDLSCTVDITKQSIEGKMQSIRLRYFLDSDEHLHFKVWSGEWGWDITDTQIKALVNNTGCYGEVLANPKTFTRKKSLFSKLFKGKK